MATPDRRPEVPPPNPLLMATVDGNPAVPLNATPDRPADRDQQQAAEYVPESRPEKVTRIGGQRLCGPACADALAAARAEEAARWQAKIEALAGELAAESAAAQQRSAEMARTDENVRHHTAERRHARVAAHTAAALRALLDAEQHDPREGDPS